MFKLGEGNISIKDWEKQMQIQKFAKETWKKIHLECNPFSYPEAPKSSQNIGIYDVFATPKKAHVAKTPLFATVWQDNMSEMLYFTVFLNHLLKKNTGIYSAFRKHMHKTPQIATNSKIASSMATRRKKQKHRYLQRFCAMIFAKKLSFWTIFGFWSLPKQRRKGTPPPPFHSLNFKICTESKTKQFLELETRPGRHFLTVFTTFFARA